MTKPCWQLTFRRDVYSLHLSSLGGALATNRCGLYVSLARRRRLCLNEKHSCPSGTTYVSSSTSSASSSALFALEGRWKCHLVIVVPAQLPSSVLQEGGLEEGFLWISADAWHERRAALLAALMATLVLQFEGGRLKADHSAAFWLKPLAQERLKGVCSLRT